MTDEDLIELFNRCYVLINGCGRSYPASGGLYCHVDDMTIERWNEDGYDELSLSDGNRLPVFAVRVVMRRGQPVWSKAIKMVRLDHHPQAEQALANLRKLYVLEDLASL
jgi:hypothetical protein